mgnify:CR=1 FL=1
MPLTESPSLTPRIWAVGALCRAVADALEARFNPVAVRGEGIALIDAAGKRYLDASGGAAVSCLGHGHPDVIAAMHAQLDRLAYAHTSFFTTEVAEQLADLNYLVHKSILLLMI